MRKPFLGIVKTAGDWLESVSVGGVLVSVTFMVGLTIAQVVCRYVLDRPIFWAEELSRYLMVWAAFLGTDIAVRNNEHCALTLLVARLSKANQRRTLILGASAMIGFGGIAAYNGLRLIAVILNTQQTSPAMGISMAVPYLAVPVGCVLIILHQVELLISLIVGEP